MLRAMKIWMLMMPAVVMLLTACINDDFRDGDSPSRGDEPTDGNVFIRFRLSLGDGMASRAEEEKVDSLTPGTENEARVNSIDIMVFAAENPKSSDDYKLIDIMYLDSKQIEAITNPAGLVVPLVAAGGKKLHIYAGVNFTPWMRSRFTLGCGTDVSLASAAADSWDVMNDFVPGSGGKSENLGTSGIPMTGQFVLTATGSADIEITAAQLQENNTLNLEANLSRIVAKVHLLTWTETYGVNNTIDKTDSVTYAIAKDYSHPESEEFGSWLGWMRLSFVRYMINGTNKSTYMFPQTQKNVDGSVDFKDLNMSLAAYRNGNLFDESLWRKDFNFYDGVSLHSANISKTAFWGKAETYYDSKLKYTSQSSYKGDNLYTKGLYCLENYFDIPADETFYKNQKNGIPVVTQLSIATRLVPRYLAVLTDFPARLDEFFKEAEDKNYSAEFYTKYGITKDDFGKEDAKRWNEIKTDYFGRDYLNKNPDPNINHGRSEVYRNDFYVFPARNEVDAMYFVNWSLIARGLWSGDDNDFESGKFPKYTYYVYDTKYDEASGLGDSKYSQRYIYLVAGAVALAKDENIGIKTYSVPHIGGWGYYYTYIDNYNGHGTVDGVTTFKASQVTRNKYYIITVENFGTPGGTITEPEYIKVNTVPVGWDYSGRGDIFLH